MNIIGCRVAYVVGFRVTYLVDDWSGSLMLDVAGFGFLAAVTEGECEKPDNRRQASEPPDH